VFRFDDVDFGWDCFCCFLDFWVGVVSKDLLQIFSTNGGDLLHFFFFSRFFLLFNWSIRRMNNGYTE
jgi:hypothetical protein